MDRRPTDPAFFRPVRKSDLDDQNIAAVVLAIGSDSPTMVARALVTQIEGSFPAPQRRVDSVRALMVGYGWTRHALSEILTNPRLESSAQRMAS